MVKQVMVEIVKLFRKYILCLHWMCIPPHSMVALSNYGLSFEDLSFYCS